MNTLEVKKENNFKISLFNGEKCVCERIFDANQYNPLIRYSLDIRDILPNFLRDLKDVLSSHDNQHNVNGVNVLNRLIQSKKKNNIDMVKPSIEFKLVLYINDNVIVERDFSVKNVNWKSLYSYDVVNYINYIKYLIEERLRINDINLMWEDYDIINKFNMSIQQVRDLDEYSRKNLLRKIYN